MDKGAMIYSQVGYCQCGQEIWIEHLRDGNEWFQRFFGPDHQEITHCLGCGREINEDDLESI